MELSEAKLREIVREELEENEVRNREEKEESKKLPWQLVITKVDNGFLLQNPNRDSVDIFNDLVVEEKEDASTDKARSQMLKELFWGIREYFGEFWNKHADYELEMKVVNQGDGACTGE